MGKSFDDDDSITLPDFKHTSRADDQTRRIGPEGPVIEDLERNLDAAFDALDEAIAGAMERLRAGGSSPSTELYRAPKIDQPPIEAWTLGAYRTTAAPTLLYPEDEYTYVNYYCYLDTKGQIYCEQYGDRTWKPLTRLRYKQEASFSYDSIAQRRNISSSSHYINFINDVTDLCNRFHQETWSQRMTKKLHDLLSL